MRIFIELPPMHNLGIGCWITLQTLSVLMFQLVRWCCKKKESSNMDAAEDPYYREARQLPQNPVYSPKIPMTQKPESTPVIIVSTMIT